ncbi:MAG: 16S rRNA (guanine(527)-N(7))-methyltransferase RsmG, partial [Giesbergeria sp.]
MSEALRAGLEQGACALGLNLTEIQIGQLLNFLTLLQKWNRVYNLTAVREPGEMLTHHLLDSLAAVPALERQLAAQGAVASARLLDVGSGGGLPGVVFAICLPQLQVHCVDTVAKKAAFIQQVAATLRLAQLHGVHARVESLPGPFDIVSSRAFASLHDFTQWSRAALAPHGVWLAMKGKLPQEEMVQLPPDVQVFHVEQ